MQQIADSLITLCDTVPQVLSQYAEEELQYKTSPGKWSKKEILGHLIDSAANNHQRFVRIQFEENPLIYYDQNAWVSSQNYQSESTADLIKLWEMYNRHLAQVIKNIPEEKHSRASALKDQSTATLKFLVEDYLSHLQHHLRQLMQG